MIMSAFVTGAAGFLGSNLVDCLLSAGETVIGWDNLSSGQVEYLAAAVQSPGFRLITGDNLDYSALTQAMKGCDIVYHFAANADVRHGLKHPQRDLEQNTIATSNVLEAMRENGIQRIVFSSTGSVYGESDIIPTPEDAPFPVQTSLYGSSKLAGECLIQSYCEGFSFEGYIFRFVSILGERYSHGHVFDFCRQLFTDPQNLTVLGDGTQRKSYLYVADCISAIKRVVVQRTALHERHHVAIYNLGCNETIQVKDSARWICEHLKVNPKMQFTGGRQGWIGDNPMIHLDTERIRATGWRSSVTIKEALIRTVDWLKTNRWIFDRRDRHGT
jgi:UDP-glucose 4-epimerase